MVATQCKNAWMVIAAAACATGLAANARGAVSVVEDLAGCTLPNGVITIPAAGAGASADRDGSLFKLSTRTMIAYPLADGGKVLTQADALSKIKASKGADLGFLPNQSGLWAFSGSISEVPNMFFLADASGQKLDAPMEIRQTTRNLAGLLTDISSGHVYLLETTDERFALLRVLEVRADAVVVQYVYQPAADMTFDIPRHPVLAYQSKGTGGTGAAAGAAGAAAAPGDAGAAVGGPKVATIGPLPGAVTPYSPASPTGADVAAENALNGGAPADPSKLARVGDANAGRVIPDFAQGQEHKTPLGPDDYVAPGVIVLNSGAQSSATSLESTLDAFTRQRSQLIARRMEIIRGPAASPAEMDIKAQAIKDLPALKASEAVDLLVDQVSFLYTRSADKQFSPDALHPAVGALKQLGKPAVDAAVRGLKKLDLNTGEGIESGRYKADLLGMVVVSVEGKDVADFLFQRELNQETESKAHDDFAYLLNKNDGPTK